MRKRQLGPRPQSTVHIICQRLEAIVSGRHRFMRARRVYSRLEELLVVRICTEAHDLQEINKLRDAFPRGRISTLRMGTRVTRNALPRPQSLPSFGRLCRNSLRFRPQGLSPEAASLEALKTDLRGKW
jgi:hypothetical protein